ncbi:SH3 domain-containing protein [Campylobacter canadensis]|uniref:SH3 domain-containing protein n=1 Tax=Campylobacter canadensis TaxID=449520 RepID=A0ABS7WT75_9BACT|nr:hypothetical protein [Campylobacter canadensis]MBZ7987502.1 hypothetical protein [Campylobacter canadensis]MBZ7994845.1 hypothetical protein [Campylobacter canadensis]MBZ7996370.1 hypothetical protein [Campylobacter canadensis]MBZ7998404.1 hypothetical protein [Campylobacter canadensis]MBZ8000118.1 hypothetical protein [Campylobacter canadensis]
MKQIIFCVFFLLNALYSQEVLSNQDAQVYNNLSQSDEVSVYDERDSILNKVELAISSTFSKNDVYVGELFYIDVDIKSNSTTNYNAQIKLNSMSAINVLNKKIQVNAKNGQYSARIYLQAQNINAKLGNLEVLLLRNNDVIANSSIILPRLKIKQIPFDKDYSFVVASDLKISNLKCAEYDNEKIICSFDASAKLANLSTFSLNKVLEQKISNQNNDYENNACSISLLLSKDSKKIVFSYFDLNKNDFILLENNIILDNAQISTQSDINPINKQFDFYLQIAALCFAVLCLLVILIFKRFYFLGIFAFCAIIYGFFGFNFNDNRLLKAGAIISILPIENSTIFYENTIEKKVEVLLEQKEFSKILFDENKIGWVKNEYLK